MLRLGTNVRHRGRDGMVIARTLGGNRSYDLRLVDGTIVKYALEEECEVVASDAGLRAPYGGARPDGLHLPG